MSKIPAEKLEFAVRGRRKSKEGGLYYPSRCGEYSLYYSDRLCGLPVEDYGLTPRWKSIYQSRIIGYHTKKSTAARRCHEHARKLETQAKKRRRNAKPDSTA